MENFRVLKEDEVFNINGGAIVVDDAILIALFLTGIGASFIVPGEKLGF